jgi:D-amino-acid dehydrogenase
MAGGRVVVVGSGVIGTACACALARAGWQVTLLEAGEFGRACSHGNCGFVCPSHVLPLATPGAVRGALKALFAPDSPLSIKPRLDPALWSWLYRFARRCNSADMVAAGRAIQALLVSSRKLYPTLLADEKIDCEWEARGLLFVFLNRPAMDHYAETDHLLREHFGLGAERVSGEELTAREPALKPGLAGGWWYDTDAHLRADRLMSGWRGALERRGVVIHTHCGLRGFATAGRQARAARTDQGDFAADAFVVATGAMTPLLQRHLGCRIPIQPGKGYSITMPRPARCPAVPLIFEEHRVAVTPFRSGYRLGSTMEFAGYDTSLPRRRLDLLRRGAQPYLHEPEAAPVEEEWYGWRPMTPDSVPIIDRSPALGNVWIAAGHNMLGLSMAPATGQLVAELLDGRTTHVDPTPYAVRRFGGC